ncbi:MAG: primosomal protein N' [Spirochaetaceae bacterium]
MSRLVNLAVPIPNTETFTYRLPEGIEAPVGVRAVAPFGRRELTGFVVGHPESGPPGVSIKEIRRIVDSEPLFDDGFLALAKWVSGFYFCSLGESLQAMIPSGRREVELSGVGDDPGVSPVPLTLSDEQEAAISQVLRKPEAMHYIYGPTGSGKTEVYLRIAAELLGDGKAVIYLVPEIALTHQVEKTIRRRFGDTVAVLHSRLTASQRLTEWNRIRREEARFVVGARSAVFAPVPRLGAIVIDEEHEGSYKSGNVPRYHARQVATKRCRDAGAPLILGSATPSMEAWHQIEQGNIVPGVLTKRLAGGHMPSIEVASLRGAPGVLTGQLVTAIRKTAEEGYQSILFLNRRGHSYFYHCRSCGYVLSCPRCSVTLTYHRSAGSAVCHYCGHREPLPEACPSCGSLDVGSGGLGTEGVEEEVMRTFPHLRVARLDTDAVRKRGALSETLRAFEAREIDILLGTQMVAKGLNFPGVKLVGIISGDTGLMLPDFRAAERTFSLITQVAGRAGRFIPDGRVIIQTLHPNAPAIRRAVAREDRAFYEEETEVRRELLFPPHARVFRFVLRGRSKATVTEGAHALSRALDPVPRDDTLGPADCPLAKIAGNHRMHLMLLTRHFGRTHGALAPVLRGFKTPAGVYLEIDVDPVSML